MSGPLVIWLEDNPAAALDAAVAALAAEQVIAFPTDTVYGLLAIGYSRSAYQGIYRMKERGFSKPLALLIQPTDRTHEEVYMRCCGAIMEPLPEHPEVMDDVGITLFCQGRLTAVLDPQSLSQYQDYIGEIQPGLVGIRCTRHSELEHVIDVTGWVWATSVNRSGSPPATTADEVLAWLDELRERGIDPPELVVLSRTPGSGQPSRVVDLTGDEPKWIR